MSISKRSLIFVFAVATAFSFFVHHQEVVAQNYSGLDMPDVYRLTQRPYKPTVEPKGPEKRALQLADRAWKREGGNSKALATIRTGQTNVRDVLNAGGDVTADADARKFLEEYTFPSMTQTDPDTVSSLGEKRRNFLKYYLNDKVTGSARAKMVDFSAEKLRAQCVDPTLAPSARINAITLLKLLTDRPMSRSSGQTPIASAKALETLLAIFSDDDPQKSPDYVKVAALSAIKHQIDINLKSGQPINPAVKTQLLDVTTKYLAAPTDRETDAAGYWNKRQAVELASLLKDANTLPALLTILNDKTSPFPLKLEVVKTLVKTGAMGSDPKANSDVLVAVCKFAESSVANEAAYIEGQIEEIERKGILYSGTDVRSTGMDIEMGEPEGDVAGGSTNRYDSGYGGGNDAGLGGQQRVVIPMVELPNYILAISRNRLRASALFSEQAIAGVRSNLDAKAEGLARSTSSKLDSLLKNTNVGLIDREQQRDADEPTIEQEDRTRKASYADQLIKVCKTSSDELGKLLSDFITEPAAASATE